MFKVINGVKGQGQILYLVSNRCTSFSFHINRTNNSWDMAKLVFDLEKKTSEIFKENLPKNTIFLLIDATAVILGQGHRKVIQYSLPELYILCPKYLRFSPHVFDVRGKSCCGGGRGGRGGRGRNELNI